MLSRASSLSAHKRSSSCSRVGFSKSERTLVTWRSGFQIEPQALSCENVCSWGRPGSPHARVFEDEVQNLYITNEGDAPSKVTLQFNSDVEMPEVHAIPSHGA